MSIASLEQLERAGGLWREHEELQGMLDNWSDTHPDLSLDCSLANPNLYHAWEQFKPEIREQFKIALLHRVLAIEGQLEDMGIKVRKGGGE